MGLFSFFRRWCGGRDDRWTVGTGADDGKLLIVRARQDVPAGIATERYRHLMIIGWKYAVDDERGMPSTAEADRMATLEDALDRSLERGRSAFMTAVVTCNGIREWQWYARDPNEAEQFLNKGLSRYPRSDLDREPVV
ncbi:MAG: DUF695 domain-containing protein [Phycisphaerae bacterium]|nr:DUF695 domain-containing protein [Phycisphaerae bacterium]